MNPTFSETSSNMKPGPEPVDLIVSIVNHNNRELLRQCLRSVLENSGRMRTEVFVVENASADGSSQMVKKEFPGVKLIANGEPMGFSANHNQVLRQASARYVLVLNDDTVVLAGALDRMVEFMDDNPRAGAVGCKILDEHGAVQHSCFDFYSLRSVFLDYCLFPGRFKQDRLLGISDPQGAEVDWVLGACILLRREALEEVGLLDESLFMYSEEVDWCFRAKQKGWQVLFVPDAEVIHYGGQSTKHQAEKMFLQLCRSRYLFFGKHYGRLHSLGLRTAIIIGTLWNTVFLFFRFIFGRLERNELIMKLGMFWSAATLRSV